MGGVGFQLNSYVIDSQRGYLARTDAANRVVNILRALHNPPQGPGSVGIIGHEGFFYHFFGIDGLRKQNFGGTNVELSPIDTALAIAGVVTAGQYFTGATTRRIGDPHPRRRDLRPRELAVHAQRRARTAAEPVLPRVETRDQRSAAINTIIPPAPADSRDRRPAR